MLRRRRRGKFVSKSDRLKIGQSGWCCCRVRTRAQGTQAAQPKSRGWRQDTHTHTHTPPFAFTYKYPEKHTHSHTHSCLSWAAVHLARYSYPHPLKSAHTIVHDPRTHMHTANTHMMSVTPTHRRPRPTHCHPSSWWDGEIGFVPWKNRPKMKVLSLVRLPYVSFAENLLVAWTHVA